MAIQPKTALLQIRLSPLMHSKLIAMAAYQDRTVSDLVRRLLSHQVDGFDSHLAGKGKSIVDGVVVQGELPRHTVNIVNSPLNKPSKKKAK